MVGRLPGSLAGRLLLIAGGSTAAALLFAAVTIGGVLERFVMRGLDERLDAQVAVLARVVETDGGLDRARVVELPGFGEPGSGWVWQVRAPDGRWWRSDAGASIRRSVLPGPPPPPPPAGRPGDPGKDGPGRLEVRPGEGLGPDGERLHLRELAVRTAAGRTVITAGGPRQVVEAPLREAELPLLLSLLLLGGGLAGATALQLRWGLRPLRALPDEIAAVMAGGRERVAEDGPRELRPLAGAVNALIAANAAGLDHARRHVANLAHGLKTPLARIAIELEASGRDPDGALREMLRDADRRVVHHLRRARAAAPGGAGRARTELAPAVRDLVAVLERVHAERATAIAASVPDGIWVAVDGQDLDEMLGNLLDNACRHAAGRVGVTAKAGETGSVAITVADDGPGLRGGSGRAASPELAGPGRRLDESRDGWGFGLAITRELAELWGGRLEPGDGAGLPGLAMRLVLPAGGRHRTENGEGMIVER
ncbi:MAG: HAMP domain-containing histidine kinase [Gluconacetobacter diazotrophicus]|nr:HAMP domain-containing histidine kinase [Gluconacetobacter diazotrophicus]